MYPPKLCHRERYSIPGWGDKYLHGSELVQRAEHELSDLFTIEQEQQAPPTSEYLRLSEAH